MSLETPCLCLLIFRAPILDARAALGRAINSMLANPSSAKRSHFKLKEAISYHSADDIKIKHKQSQLKQASHCCNGNQSSLHEMKGILKFFISFQYPKDRKCDDSDFAVIKKILGRSLCEGVFVILNQKLLCQHDYNRHANPAVLI